MASTYSALKVELLETGANSGTWGTLTNVNLGDAILGEAITGSATVNFPTDADVTVTLTDSSTSQSARNLRLNITESSTGVGSVRNLILGSGCQIEKFYLIRNNGTGVKTIKNTSGTGVAVAAGKATLVYNDGTNVVDVLNSFSSAILGAENAGSIIPFYFANQAAFPSASTYHGAIAHSHADGAMYFAHGGVWTRLLDGAYATTATAGGTTTLTVSSAAAQFFTGTSAQTIVLPVASTLVLGQTFSIHNNSTSDLTVNSSGSNLVATVTANTTCLITCILTSGTSAASFDADFTGFTSTLPVARGGTALTTGTSGGVLAYTAAGTLASSGVLAQYGVVIGGGAGAVPTSTAVGTATHILTSNGAGVAPTFQANTGVSTGKSIAMAMIFGF